MLVKINFICVQPFEFQAAFNTPVGMQHSSPYALVASSTSPALRLPHSLMKTTLDSRSPIVPISNLRPRSLRNQLCTPRLLPATGRAHKIAYQKFTRFALPNMLHDFIVLLPHDLPHTTRWRSRRGARAAAWQRARNSSAHPVRILNP